MEGKEPHLVLKRGGCFPFCFWNRCREIISSSSFCSRTTYKMPSDIVPTTSALFASITPLNILVACLAYVSFCVAYQIIHYRVCFFSLSISSFPPRSFFFLFPFACSDVWKQFFHPLSKFPGPFWASVTRLWVAYHNLMEDECQIEYDLHKRHGM